MASPGELVEAMASALGVPAASLAVHDRNLVMAGARSKGGRGWSAASVTPRDAAHLLIAVLASAQIKDSVASLTRYGGTRVQKSHSSAALYRGLGIPELEALAPQHSFVDALEALIGAAAFGSHATLMGLNPAAKLRRHEMLIPQIEIAALSPGTMGDIRIAGTGKKVSRSVRYGLPGPGKNLRKPTKEDWEDWERMMRSHRKDGDLDQYRRVSERTIFSIARLLSGKQE